MVHVAVRRSPSETEFVRVAVVIRITQGISVDWGPSLMAVLLGTIGLLTLIGRTGLLPGLPRDRGRLRNTTLLAPCYWTVLAILALMATAFAATLPPVDWIEPVRYAAAVATFCPPIAILGAKRPQDRAWQVVVSSLWAILLVPVVTCWLRPGEPLHIHPVWSWFLVILITVSLLNHLFTRFWPSALLLCMAQVILLFRHLPLVSIPDSNPELGTMAPLVGLGLIVLSILLVAAGFPFPRTARHPLDRVWIDFRDMFGTIWGLRVAARINANAARFGWRISLDWNGFSTTSDSPELPADVAKAIQKNLRTLLRRFVSSDWIAHRLGKP